MKRILVPCDFSRQSKEAFKVAIEMSAKVKGEIFLIHVLALPELYSSGISGEPLAFDAGYFTEVEEDSKKELEKMKKEGSDSSVKVNTEVIYGELTSSVRKLIDDHSIDLVVMGTSGASGFAEIFIGSNTEKIVRFSPVPVLAIRRAIDLNSIKNILLPSTVDLNQTDFMKRLTELQKFFNATLHVLLVNTPIHFRRDAEARAAMEEFAKHYQLTNYKIHFRSFDREDDGIVEFANSEKMDLVAMATHARKGLAHLFNVSLTERVVNHIQIPIWTYCLKVGI